MSEPRFGAWTATADRLPDTAGLVIGEWPDGETGPVCYSEFPGWMDGDCPMNPPVRWMPMPAPGETAGPGEATRRVMELARETVKAVGLDPAKHVGCGYLCRVRLDLDDIATASSCCGWPRHAVKKGDGVRYRCRPCEMAYQRENYAKNAERIRKRKAEQMAAARKDPVARQRILASQRKSWRNGGSEKRRAYMERIKTENPWLWKTITTHGAYRGQNGADVLKAIWDHQGGLCGLTGVPLDFETAQLDHILPRSRGGSNDESNLRWTTKEANEAKGGMTDEEFLVLCNQVAEFIGRRLVEHHRSTG